MTVIAAMYLPDSPFHIVSILCHVCQQLIATGRSLARQPHSCLCSSVQSQRAASHCLSRSYSWPLLALLSWPWLMTSSVLLCNLTFLRFILGSVFMPPWCDTVHTKSTSVNLQFAKLEQRTYGLYGPGMRMRNRRFRTYAHRAMLGKYISRDRRTVIIYIYI